MKLYRIIAIAWLCLVSGCHEFQPGTAQGRRVAERWCSECHGTSGLHPGHASATPEEAPSFAQIAAYSQVNRQFLENFFDRIIVMPIYQLSATEKEEVIVYILSLKRSN